MFTGIGVGLVVGCFVFCSGHAAGAICWPVSLRRMRRSSRGAYDYLKGFAPETIVTAFLFSMIGYFNGNNRTVWVMTQGMITDASDPSCRFAYVMSIQPDASLTMIGLAAPVSTTVRRCGCVHVYYWHMNHKKVQPGSQERGEVEARLMR